MRRRRSQICGWVAAGEQAGTGEPCATRWPATPHQPCARLREMQRPGRAERSWANQHSRNHQTPRTAAANCWSPGIHRLTGLADSRACMKASCAEEASSWGAVVGGLGGGWCVACWWTRASAAAAGPSPCLPRASAVASSPGMGDLKGLAATRATTVRGASSCVRALRGAARPSRLVVALADSIIMACLCCGEGGSSRW